MTQLIDTGVVIIGRNEGERLRRCIESVIGRVALVVYVDSGSTDDSVATARCLNAHVHELDTAVPFTAARARNAGVCELLRIRKELRYVQFIDGDCELREGWLHAAHEQAETAENVAAVCGRRRERHPQASVYNRLIDMEWNTPVGETEACGGDVFMRLSAFHNVGMYPETMIAGEEPELCLRLRRNGWRVLRIDHEMTWHDANITRFSQWWKRAVRAGHAYAESRAMHGASAERYCVDEVRSILEWAFVLPIAAVTLAFVTWGLSLFLLAGYILLMARVRKYWISRGYSAGEATRAAYYCAIGKFPELIGVGAYYWNRLWRKPTQLIEYKQSHQLGSQ